MFGPIFSSGDKTYPKPSIGAYIGVVEEGSIEVRLPSSPETRRPLTIEDLSCQAPGSGCNSPAPPSGGGTPPRGRGQRPKESLARAHRVKTEWRCTRQILQQIRYYILYQSSTAAWCVENSMAERVLYAGPLNTSLLRTDEKKRCTSWIEDLMS